MSAPGTGSTDPVLLLNSIIAEYSKYFVGRERTIRLILLALVTKQHIYMISPPGTGKTMMEAVARSFGLKTFYYLYSYDTKLEDILYNVIIRRVRSGDEEKIVIDYELRDPGIGTVDIHFADEMFKSPSIVLNALLGLMNERRVTLGNKEFKVPLRTLIAASNELPERAEALLDRFLFRDFLEYLPKEFWLDYLVKYWRMHQPDFNRLLITVPAQVLEEAYSRMWKVDISPILDLYLQALEKLHDKQIIVSDRRKGRILQAVTASAVMAGRTEAAPEDLEVLLYTVPTRPEELDTVKAVVDEVLGGILKLKEELENLRKQLEGYVAKARALPLDEVARIIRVELPTIKNKVIQISFPSLQYYTEKLGRAIEEAEEQLIDVFATRLLEA